MFRQALSGSMTRLLHGASSTAVTLKPAKNASLIPLLTTMNMNHTTGCACLPCKGFRSFHSTGFRSKCKHVDDNELKKKLEAYVDKDEKENGKLTIDGTMPDLEDVLENNKKWVVEKNKNDPDFFPRNARGQTPRYLYIGCSDARVDPGQLMGLNNAELFVHRNVGNVVSGTDLNFLTVLEYAVDTLKVPHIIVCGHYDCGAVRGSISRPDSGGLGLIENWLRNIRDVARLHKDELKAIKDKEELQRRLVELNVMEQCLNIFKSACVQRRRLRTYVQDHEEFALPRVHGLVFDPAVGILKKLPLNFKREIEEYREIYDLYQVPEWARKPSSPSENSQAEFWEGRKPNEK
uniref:Carbonic anhydrase n=1 Tax=Aplanochytrium stocchinoi TaxID=215587 RepID=A0A7S3PLP3_9STRA|mmetsp:Transcript_25420/g.31150  ORF Transcript_25420/g.31150 Transcript_25420/m.31150 type:complete len:349 (+) Transcript_25420:345-1391(+)